MKKIIHDKSAQLVCDNPSCDYEAQEGEFEFGPHLVGMPCPKCGENLLTEVDYQNHIKLKKGIDFLNYLADMIGLGSETLEEAKAKAKEAGIDLPSMSFRSVNGKWVNK